MSNDDEPTISEARPSKEAPASPTRLAGRYEVQALLGSGGMGSVFLARDLELEELVALKMIKGSDKTLLERFRDEVRLARKVTHKNVARTFDIGEHDGEKFLTMEYIAGDSLARELEREGALRIREIVRIGSEMCAGLSAAHDAGVIHRDFKPGNVMIASDGRVVITDFGLATRRHRLEEHAVGTLPYMAPEQFAGKAVDERTDVYALGAVLYRMATAQRPFEELPHQRKTAPNPCQRRAQLPLELGRLVSRCLEPDPAERWSSARDVGKALAAIDATNADEEPPLTRRMNRLLATPTARRIAVVLEEQNALAEGLRATILERLAAHPILHIVDVASAEAVLVLGLSATPERLRLRIHGTSGGMTFWTTTLAEPWSRAIELVLRATTHILEALNLDVAKATELDPIPAALIERYFETRVDLRARDPERAARAIGMLEQMLREAPDHPMLLSSLAHGHSRLSFFRAASFESALRITKEAVRLGGAIAESHAAEGVTLWQAGDALEAVRSLLRALAIAPGLVDARLTLGVIAMEAGLVGPGLELAEDAVTRVPSLVTAWIDIARTHYLLGYPERAETCFEKIPQSTYAHTLIGATRLRSACWRRDREAIANAWSVVSALPPGHAVRLVVELYALVAMEKETPRDVWTKYRTPGAPRRAIFEAQVLAELAAYARDWDLALEGIQIALDQGLCDRLWLDRCPLFDDMLGTKRFEDLRDVARGRAREVIAALDAAPGAR